MGCLIAIIGILVSILGFFLLSLAHSFSSTSDMIWGIVLIVLGAIMYFGGLIFDIFFKKENVNRAIIFGAFALWLLLGLLGWMNIAYPPIIGTIIFLCFLFGSIALITLWNHKKRKGE